MREPSPDSHDTYEVKGHDTKKVIVDFDIPLSPRTSTRFVLGGFSILSQRAGWGTRNGRKK